MKRLIYLILFVFLCVIVACSAMDKKAFEGQWMVELEGSRDTVFVIGNDTVVAPQFRFYNDSVYMEVWQNGVRTKSENMGIYYIRDEKFVFVDKRGNKSIMDYEIKDNVLFIKELDNPGRVLMRLVRIKEN